MYTINQFYFCVFACCCRCCCCFCWRWLPAFRTWSKQHPAKRSNNYFIVCATVSLSLCVSVCACISICDIMPCNKKATFTKAKRIQYICINVIYIYMHTDISWTYIHIVRVGVLCMCSCRKRDGKVRGACKLQRVKSCKGKFLSNATISLAHTHTQLLKVATVSAVCIRMQANQGKARQGWMLGG